MQLASWIFCGNLNEIGSSSRTMSERTFHVHHSHTSACFIARVGGKFRHQVPQRGKPWRACKQLSLLGVISKLLSHQRGFDHGLGLCAFVRHNPFGSNLDCLWITLKLLFADDLVDLQLLALSQFSTVSRQRQIWDRSFPHPFGCSPNLLQE